MIPYHLARIILNKKAPPSQKLDHVDVTEEADSNDGIDLLHIDLVIILVVDLGVPVRERRITLFSNYIEDDIAY